MTEKTKIFLVCLSGYFLNLIDFFTSRYLGNIDISAEKNSLYKWLFLNNYDLIVKVFFFPILMIIAYKICSDKDGYYARFVLYGFILCLIAVCLNNIWVIIQYKGGI